MSRATQKMERLSDREFAVSRTFTAPRELVWQAWTQCQHLQRWWAPAGWSVPVCKMDFRVGGTWHYCMKGTIPDGTEVESWGLTVYQEIVKPERIVALDQFADAAGNVSAEMPKMLNTITFTAVDSQTVVNSHIEVATVDDLETIISMGMEEGMTESWDQLEALLMQLQK
ncbi:MAG: SRPBCC domain-containing protein [Caldilineaceae bacterium]